MMYSDRTMTNWYAKAGKGYLLAYSIAHRGSFENLKIWADTLLRMRGESPPIMVVGTKCDRELDREVTIQEGLEFATKLHGLRIETSAKLDVNVDAAFMDLVKLVRRRRNQKNQSAQPTQLLTANNSANLESGCRCIIF
ncbi:ras-domain-containing protein [Serendipita vermifera]|nr:ras-domain-containing protein [Serendipita vermifera]